MSSDNTTLAVPAGSTAGDTIRTITRNGVKTQVVQIDWGGETEESLSTASNPLLAAVIQAGDALWQHSNAQAEEEAAISITLDSTTPVNTVLMSPVQGFGNIAVGITTTGTITAGDVAFECSVDDTNWAALAMQRVSGIIGQETNYSPVTGTLLIWQMFCGGFFGVRVRLDQALVGSGSVLVYLRPSVSATEFEQLVFQPDATALHSTCNTVGAAGDVLDAPLAPATAPGHGIAILCAYQSTPPVLTSGQSVGKQCGWDGTQFVQIGRRSNVLVGNGSIASTTPATLLAADGAGSYTDLAGLVLTNAESATGSMVVLISDGTRTYSFSIGGANTNVPVAPLSVSFSPPLPATNTQTAWTIALSAAKGTVYYVATFLRQKAN